MTGANKSLARAVLGVLCLVVTAETAAEVIPMQSIRLPPPHLDGSMSVERAIAQRRSLREFSSTAITLAELGQLLWAGQGVTSAQGLRAAPSAGALYPLDVMVVAGNVTGLPPGVYRYSPADHALSQLATGDSRRQVAMVALRQSWMAQAPAIIAFCAAERRTTAKYGSKGISYIYIEVGHAAENVFLEAQALGLGAAVVGAFDEVQIARVLRLSTEQRPLYLMRVGRAGPP